MMRGLVVAATLCLNHPSCQTPTAPTVGCARPWLLPPGVQLQLLHHEPPEREEVLLQLRRLRLGLREAGGGKEIAQASQGACARCVRGVRGAGRRRPRRRARLLQLVPERRDLALRPLEFPASDALGRREGGEAKAAAEPPVSPLSPAPTGARGTTPRGEGGWARRRCVAPSAPLRRRVGVLQRVQRGRLRVDLLRVARLALREVPDLVLQLRPDGEGQRRELRRLRVHRLAQVLQVGRADSREM